MPKVGYIEKTIYNLEGVNVDFVQNGRNVRSEVQLPCNYSYERQLKNSANVSSLRERLERQFPGYEFIIYKGNGDPAPGNMLMGNLRDTY